MHSHCVAAIATGDTRVDTLFSTHAIYTEIILLLLALHVNSLMETNGNLFFGSITATKVTVAPGERAFRNSYRIADSNLK